MSLFKSIVKSVKKILRIKRRVRSSQKRKVKKTSRKSSRRRQVKSRASGRKFPLRTTAKVSRSPKVYKIKVDEVIKKSSILVGHITHFFDRISVCVVNVTHGVIKKGDRLRIKGKSGELIQKVQSMQIESVDVSIAKKGQMIGLKVDKSVRVKDVVYQLPS